MGQLFPGALARSEIRGWAELQAPGAILVFTDFLQTRQVWQWVERTGEVAILREFSHRAEHASGKLALRLDRRIGVRRNHRGRGSRATEQALTATVVAALIARASRLTPPEERDRFVAQLPAEPTAGTLHGLIRSATHVQLRALWRAVRTFSVVDTACANGQRLAAVFRLLAPVYDAIIERMSAYLFDLDHAPHRGRAETLGDFRRALAALPSAGPEREEVIAAWTVANNLFGADPSAAAVRLCRARLRRCLGRNSSPSASALLRLNIRVGTIEDTPDPLRRRRANPWEEEARRILSAERAMLHRSVHLLRTSDTTSEVSGWEVATARIERRQRALEAAIRATVEPSSRFATDIPPVPVDSVDGRLLNIRIAYPGRHGSGCFDAVLPADLASGNVHSDGQSLPSGRPPSSETIRAREEPMTYSVEGPPEGVGPGQQRVRPLGLELESALYPARVRDALGSAAPDPLYVLGEPRQLSPPLLGLFCSTRMPPDLVLSALEVVREITFAGIPAVGGFHTPVEKEWLRMLLEGGSRVIACRARGLVQRRLPLLWEEGLRVGTLTLVSPFGPDVRRPTIQSSAERNELVGALATALFVAHASPGGMTHELARTLVDRGTRVLTLDHPLNHDILRSGAEVVQRGEELVTAAAL